MLGVIASLVAVVPASSAPAEPMKVVEQALFDVCPRLFANSLKLTEQDQLAPLGYEKGALRGKVQFYDRKIAGHFVEISYTPDLRVCWVNFAGPKLQALFDGTEAAMRQRGFTGDAAAKLGGPSRMVKLERRVDNDFMGFTQLIAIVGGDTPLSMVMLTDKEDKK